jgi:undecaprenyl pyrophosphate phosphatase UppP
MDFWDIFGNVIAIVIGGAILALARYTQKRIMAYLQRKKQLPRKQRKPMSSVTLNKIRRVGFFATWFCGMIIFAAVDAIAMDAQTRTLLSVAAGVLLGLAVSFFSHFYNRTIDLEKKQQHEQKPPEESDDDDDVAPPPSEETREPS